MKTLFLLVAVLLHSAIFCYGYDGLQVGFYEGKCGFTNVETIIRAVVTARYFKDPTIVAALLRMQFHDCFVEGCDASILLDGSSSEKTAIPNLSVRGYDIIDQAKAVLESICPGVVSCADIIVAATRDAVSLAGGRRYDVETGRRDGLVSLASNVNLPAPSFSVSQSVAAFANKGLDLTDMILLLGGHTVGVAHCPLFQDRLYNFQGSGKPDLTMDASLLANLQKTCPENSNKAINTTANLDQGFLSAFAVDKSYYKQILMNKGILQIDQELALDSSSRAAVMSLAIGSNFIDQFSKAMVKLGSVDVLTGTEGQIRKSCRNIN